MDHTPKPRKNVARSMILVLACVIASGATTYVIAGAVNDNPDEPPVAPQEAQEARVSWYVEASTIPPPTPNGSLTVTLHVTSPDADAYAQKPGLLNVTVIYLPFDVTAVDLGDNPASALNAAMQAQGGGDWFDQYQFHGAGESTTKGFPHYAIDSTGTLREVVSVVVFLPETGSVMAMDFTGQKAKWSTITVDGEPAGSAWTQTNEARVKAAEANEAQTRPE